MTKRSKEEVRDLLLSRAIYCTKEFESGNFSGVRNLIGEYNNLGGNLNDLADDNITIYDTIKSYIGALHNPRLKLNNMITAQVATKESFNSSRPYVQKQLADLSSRIVQMNQNMTSLQNSFEEMNKFLEEVKPTQKLENSSITGQYANNLQSASNQMSMQ